MDRKLSASGVALHLPDPRSGAVALDLAGGSGSATKRIYHVPRQRAFETRPKSGRLERATEKDQSTAHRQRTITGPGGRIPVDGGIDVALPTAGVFNCSVGNVRPVGRAYRMPLKGVIVADSESGGHGRQRGRSGRLLRTRRKVTRGRRSIF